MYLVVGRYKIRLSKTHETQILLFLYQAVGSTSGVGIREAFPDSDVEQVSGDINTLSPRQNERHFADDIFKCIFVNENVWIPIKISLKFVPKGPINNFPALVQIMAWTGDKPLFEPMMVSLPTHICVTRPQWVKTYMASPDGVNEARQAGGSCMLLDVWWLVAAAIRWR